MRSPMNGRALTPSEQLKVLTRVWGAQRDGYVFMPWIRGDSSTKEQRRKNYHEGRAYEWPRERTAILAHLQEHAADDLYFCPNIFNGKRRNEELADAERTLWADLDDVDPRKLGDRRPTIAWESSPGRYQGIWILDRMRHGASWPGKENHRLTYEIGADPSGWDSTQLLRVPGRPNHKPEYRENGDSSVPGRLMWMNGPMYVWEDFDDLPEIGQVDPDELELMDDDFLAGIDRHEVWGRVRLRVSPRVRKYMAMRHEHEIDGADRSDVLWDIERELADAGCTLAEIVALIRPTVWNKYSGRNDELRRLKTEAAKALGAAKEGGDGGALEIIETPKPKTLTSIDDFFAEIIPRPKWLIKNIWPEGGCGFIAGAPKSYKSWLALDLAISLSTGTSFLCDEQFPVMGGPKRVLYLQQEDSKSLVKDRFDTVVDGKSPHHNRRGSLRWGREFTAAGHEKDVLWWEPPLPMDGFFMQVRSGFVASEEGWQSWLDEVMAEYKLDCLIIDTLFASAGNVDTDKGQEMMTKMLQPLRELSEKHGCAVVIVHHNKKDAGGRGGGNGSGNVTDHLSDRAGKDMLGSTALHAWVDTALYVRARAEVDRIMGLNVAVPSTGRADEGGVDGAVTYVGVPGTEIFVERESKLAEEMRIRVGIPRMVRETGGAGADGSGSGKIGADRWMPVVEHGWRRVDEGSEGESTEGKKSDRRRDGQPLDRGRGLPAGDRMFTRLKEMGVTLERGKDISDIVSILDLSERTVIRQLKVLTEQGRVRVDVAGKWFLAEEQAEDS